MHHLPSGAHGAKRLDPFYRKMPKQYYFQDLTEQLECLVGTFLSSCQNIDFHGHLVNKVYEVKPRRATLCQDQLVRVTKVFGSEMAILGPQGDQGMNGLQGEMGEMGSPGRDAMRVINLPGPMGRSLPKYRFSK